MARTEQETRLYRLATNVALLDPLGVGKTHSAVALSTKALEEASGVDFVRTHDFVDL